MLRFNVWVLCIEGNLLRLLKGFCCFYGEVSQVHSFCAPSFGFAQEGISFFVIKFYLVLNYNEVEKSI